MLTQLLEEGRVALALRCKVFLSKVQRLLHLALAHQLYQALLLEMEGQLRLQLQDLQACSGHWPASFGAKAACAVRKINDTVLPRLRQLDANSLCRPHLRIKIIDQVNGLLNVTALDCFANVHPVRDGV